MKKKRIKTSIIIIFGIICLILTIYSAYKIIVWKINVEKNNEIKNEIKNYVKIEENNEEEKYNIDFKSLKEINSDVISWIKVNGTNIEYPIVKGNDNNYYLTHNLKKEWNIAGWIFADYKNKFDGTDKNIVIYGHDTKDGSMFGTLKNVLDKKWQDNIENHNIIFNTENNSFIYQVFSTYIVDEEDYYINTIFNNENEFSSFINTLKSRSNYDYNIDVNSNDIILTLSSCIGDGSKRVVLHAKKM